MEYVEYFIFFSEADFLDEFNNTFLFLLELSLRDDLSYSASMLFAEESSELDRYDSLDEICPYNS